MSHRDLAGVWRDRAAERMAEGNEAAAAIYSRCANELTEYDVRCELERISLGQAAAETGYSRSHLARLIAQGNLTNGGTRGAPLVIRGELPKKPRRTTRRRTGTVDLVADAFAKTLGVSNI